MIINHNISALNAHRQLGANQGATQGSLEKLSSGLQINKAGDDAAGLAISEKMRGQINGLEMASKNAQDGISLIQTAEGALNETHSILQRMRELAVQSSSDTNTDEDRAELQKEVDQLAQEISRIAEDTEFNTQNLLGGEFEGTFHIGANEGQNIDISINAMDSQTLNVSDNISGLTEAEGTVGGVNDATVLQDEGGNNIAVQVEDKWYAATDVTDEDGTLTVAEGAKELNLTSKLNESGEEEFTVNKGVDISDQASADKAITTINSAIETVSAERSKLGAVQNRLEHTINNLGTSAENLTAAESRIRDVDMAKEMMEFTKNNILSQAAQSMLAQANQQPQGVLQLLQ